MVGIKRASVSAALLLSIAERTMANPVDIEELMLRDIDDGEMLETRELASDLDHLLFQLRDLEIRNGVEHDDPTMSTRGWVRSVFGDGLEEREIDTIVDTMVHLRDLESRQSSPVLSSENWARDYVEDLEARDFDDFEERDLEDLEERDFYFEDMEERDYDDELEERDFYFDDLEERDYDEELEERDFEEELEERDFEEELEERDEEIEERDEQIEEREEQVEERDAEQVEERDTDKVEERDAETVEERAEEKAEENIAKRSCTVM
ncbi:unnamed protein product [Clonostachys rhizophaga]|uniref:Uncharacterized protein n=1 Tax=Clonostachys rhizophaga TaxID=160324 RepID=A0A9N9VPZ4_9HYPO|nr:unnamed protein product [Clonostachys rhizophaga]